MRPFSFFSFTQYDKVYGFTELGDFSFLSVLIAYEESAIKYCEF